MVHKLLKTTSKFIYALFVCSFLSTFLSPVDTALAEQGLPPPTSREELYERAAITELWQPLPPMVSTISGSAATNDQQIVLGANIPSDATVLLGKSGALSAWRHAEGADAQWDYVDGVMTVRPGSGDIFTRETFGSVQLHIEWASPAKIVSEGQGRGNSGVFFMEEYEVQVLDSYDNPTYVNGQAGSVYKQHIPLVNASRPPGVWQSYDIVFTQPIFSENQRLVHPARLTVFHNGVLIQNNVELQGPTEFVGKPNYQAHGKASLKLQDHGNYVQYRNIWVRPL